MDLTMTIMNVPVKTVGAGGQRQETSFKLEEQDEQGEQGELAPVAV